MHHCITCKKPMSEAQTDKWGNQCGACWKKQADATEAKFARKTIRSVVSSHYPDLSERLIETHRTLQMSREYLMGFAIDDRKANHACDHILDAMQAVEQAIEKLST